VTAERASYDLHLHTCWSYDATNEVEDVFGAARESGVSTIAITDHHVMDAIPEALEVAGRFPDIRHVIGAELSVTTSIGSVDLVCLGLPREPAGELAAVLDAYHDWQRASGAWIVKAMQALGFEYDEAEQARLLASYRPERAVKLQGITHIKNEVRRSYLVEKSYITGGDEYAEFNRRMARAAGAPPPYPPVESVAPAVRSAGGLVFIAHPVGYFARDDRRRMDALVAECGADGIECGHRAVPPELVRLYRDYCLEKGLLSSGGSDSHAPELIGERMGAHPGEAEWLDEIIDRLGG